MMQPTSGIPQKKAEIIELYNNNVRVKTIAETLGFNYLTLRKYIVRWKRDGSLAPGRRDKTHNYPKTRKSPTKKVKVEEVKEEPQKEEKSAVEIFLEGTEEKPASIMQHNLERICWNENPVICTREVSRECIWGTAESSANLCDFLCRTGRSRGCHWQECHRFSQITETNKRAKTPFLI